MILKRLGTGKPPSGITVYGMPGVVEFIDAVADPDDADAIDALLEWVTEHGTPKNRHKCWKLGDGIFELKPYGVRLPFFHHPGIRWTIVITHGFNKQGQRTPSRHIEQAKQQRQQFIAELEKGKVSYDDMA